MLPRQTNTTNKLGYHRGSLNRKSEQLSQMFSRSTGYFGTGFYFCTGEYLDGSTFENRDKWIFDLSSYKLIRGTIRLHQCLKELQSYIMFYPLSMVVEEALEVRYALQKLTPEVGGARSVDGFCDALIDQDLYQKEWDRFTDALHNINIGERLHYRWLLNLIKEGKQYDNIDDMPSKLYDDISSFLNNQLFNYELIERWKYQDLHDHASALGIDQSTLIDEIIPVVFEQLQHYFDPQYCGLRLFNATEADSIPTRILKYLGYDGVYPDPECNNSTYGGVLFDLQDGTYHKDTSERVSLKESYQDFDASSISTYVKSFTPYANVPYESANDFLGDLNDHLQPLNVKVVDCYDYVRWITPNIAYGALNSDGSVHIEIDATRQMEAINECIESGQPPNKDPDFAQFLKDLAQVVVHEYVHLHQMSSRSPTSTITVDPDDAGMWAYLSNSDEIDAHALAGVQEARDIGYTDDQLLDALSSKTAGWELLNELNATTAYADFLDPMGRYTSDEERVWRRLVKTMTNSILSDHHRSSIMG